MRKYATDRELEIIGKPYKSRVLRTYANNLKPLANKLSLLFTKAPGDGHIHSV